jgi:hypothetical protein
MTSFTPGHGRGRNSLLPRYTARATRLPPQRGIPRRTGPYLVAQLAHATCHEVSSVGARQFAANCASNFAGALTCFASRFSGRADMSSCAKDDGKNCIKEFAVPERHSHAIATVVCICCHPKASGHLIYLRRSP